MSNFDPFGIYVRSEKKTHQGQIVRKKFPKPPDVPCYSKDEINVAMNILKNNGYIVHPPGWVFRPIVAFSRGYVFENYWDNPLGIDTHSNVRPKNLLNNGSARDVIRQILHDDFADVNWGNVSKAKITLGICSFNIFGRIFSLNQAPLGALVFSQLIPGGYHNTNCQAQPGPDEHNCLYSATLVPYPQDSQVYAAYGGDENISMNNYKTVAADPHNVANFLWWIEREDIQYISELITQPNSNPAWDNILFQFWVNSGNEVQLGLDGNIQMCFYINIAYEERIIVSE